MAPSLVPEWLSLWPGSTSPSLPPCPLCPAPLLSFPACKRWLLLLTFSCLASWFELVYCFSTLTVLPIPPGKTRTPPTIGIPRLTTELPSVGWKPGYLPNMDPHHQKFKSQKMSWDFPFQQPHVVIPTPVHIPFFTYS